MQQWEYTVTDANWDPKRAEGELNGYGADGWELVTAYFRPNDGTEASVDNEHTRYIFKRPLHVDTPQGSGERFDAPRR
jgi:hypothetical protein